MICKASIVSVIYVVTFTQNAELFCPKKLSVFRKCGVFFASSAFAEDKKKQKMSEARLEPGTSILPSFALTTTPSHLLQRVISKQRISKKLKIFFSSQKKNYKITFVGITDEILWANFGDPVTSIFVKNSQKRKN